MVKHISRRKKSKNYDDCLLQNTFFVNNGIHKNKNLANAVILIALSQVENIISIEGWIM